MIEATVWALPTKTAKVSSMRAGRTSGNIRTKTTFSLNLNEMLEDKKHRNRERKRITLKEDEGRDKGRVKRKETPITICMTEVCVYLEFLFSFKYNPSCQFLSLPLPSQDIRM